jgi:cytosine/adenosine deaminase-related metal-dependent hydrolase
MAPNPASTLYIHGTIITVNRNREILLDGALHITGDRIVSVGKTSSLLDSPNIPPNTKIIDLRSKIVIPGLINAHAHLMQSLMRGLGEDMDLHRWACDMVWPLEASYLPGDGYIAAKLTMAEMLKSGTTCFLEPMLPSQAVLADIVQAVGEVGIRGCLGVLVKAQKSNARAGAKFKDARDKNASEMSVQGALDKHSEHHGKFDGRVQVWLAAETPRGVDEAVFAKVGVAREKDDLMLTVHVAEDARDKVLIRECYKASPVQFCENNKLTSNKTVLAHMCHLDLDVDLEILKRTGTSVAHNPTSNCKLSDGIAPVPQMLDYGVNVALGTDGIGSNSYDLFRDMHLAGILHKGVTMNPKVLPAEQVLEMATINGAKALGLEDDIGSLETGKKADFVVVNSDSLYAAPYDLTQVGEGGMHPVTAVVHSASGNDVDMVVVDGAVLVERGNLIRIDEQDTKLKAKEAIVRIRVRSGVASQPLKMGWNYV